MFESEIRQFDLSTAKFSSNKLYGKLALVSETTIVAGEHVTCCFEYVAGEKPVLQGGTIIIFTDSDSDWARPQIINPTGSDYLRVDAPNGVRIAVHVSDHNLPGGIKRSVLITLLSGKLTEGEKLTITFGDKTEGGSGTRCQTFFESSRNSYCAVDLDGSGNIRFLEKYPAIQIMGGDMSNINIHAPSDIALGKQFRLVIKVEDKWGNPAQNFQGSLEIDAAGLKLSTTSFALTEKHRGVLIVDNCAFVETGADFIAVTAYKGDQQLTFRSNPLAIHEEVPDLKLYWGDPHSGQVANPHDIANYFEYARDVSGLDYAGFQRNDHYHSTQAYLIQQQAEKQFNDSDRFVVLPGFEWSADFEHGGHHNVYFSRFDRPIKRWRGAERLGEEGETNLPHVRDLYNYYRSTDTIITPHVGGQHADLSWHDPDLQPALEITSTHGTFEWFLEESLSRGYEMGFVGGNDCHTGRPGDDRPGHQIRRYSKGGLTGTYANELTLSGVFEAIKAKRVYATTGAKIRAAFFSDEHFMGEKYSTTAPPRLRVDVSGTNPLERIEIYRGTELIHLQDLRGGRQGNSIRVLWEGESKRSSYSGIMWKGTIDFGELELIGSQTIRFDSPRSYFKLVDDSKIAFTSWTCGYPSGLILNFESESNSEIRVDLDSSLMTGERGFGEELNLAQDVPSVLPRTGFSSEMRTAFAQGDSVSVRTTLQEVSSNEINVALGGLNRRLQVQNVPMSDKTKSVISFTDDNIKPGVNAYWAKIVQQDMEMAWLSPIFITYYEE